MNAVTWSSYPCEQNHSWTSGLALQLAWQRNTGWQFLPSSWGGFEIGFFWYISLYATLPWSNTRTHARSHTIIKQTKKMRNFYVLFRAATLFITVNSKRTIYSPSLHVYTQNHSALLDCLLPGTKFSDMLDTERYLLKHTHRVSWINKCAT